MRGSPEPATLSDRRLLLPSELETFDPDVSAGSGDPRRAAAAAWLPNSGEFSADISCLMPARHGIEFGNPNCAQLPRDPG